MRQWLMAAIVVASACGRVLGQGVEPGTVPETPAVRPGLARISGGAMAGQILKRKTPVYPAEAKAAGVSGSVVLHAIVGKTGLVEEVTVVSGPEMLRQAALDAVQGWVYRPYLLNGEPTDVDTTVTVNFSLAGRRDSLPESGGGESQESAADSSGQGRAPVIVAPRPEGPIRISSGVLQGLLEEKVDPVYPQTQQSGAVVLRVRVGRQGEVTDVTAISGPESLREASVEAVKQWMYRPYLLNGQPMEVDSTVTVMFTRH